MADDSKGSNNGRNGKLRIPLPFEDALKAATEVQADKLPKPNGKPSRARGKKRAKP